MAQTAAQHQDQDVSASLLETSHLVHLSYIVYALKML